MRTTLDIEDDVLQAAKELAQRDGTTAGRVISDLARRGLASGSDKVRPRTKLRNGVPVLPRRDEIITLDKVRRLMDDEGV